MAEMDSATKHQELAWSVIKQAFHSGVFSHAYLFTGPPGLGQREAAVRLVSATTCRAPGLAVGDSWEPCGNCPQCRKVVNGNHPDVHWLEADGPSLKLAQIRSVLHEIWFQPLEGSRRCFVIADADRLTPEAAARLLKILEEPPSYALFILMAESVASLPSTVVSRCYIVPFRPLSPPVLAEKIQAEHGLDVEAARALAHVTGGNPGLAAEWLQRSWFPDLVDRIFRLLADLQARGPLAALQGAEELAALDDEGVAAALTCLQYALRDIWLFAFGLPSGYAVFGDKLSLLPSLAAQWGRFDYERCVAAIAVARSQLRAHVQTRNVFDALLLKLVNLRDN